MCSGESKHQLSLITVVNKLSQLIDWIDRQLE